MRHPGGDAAFSAYESFADVYDDFTADHDYEAWIDSLERVVLAAGLDGRRQLDVACGTGKSLVPWLERGYSVEGCDLSPRMLLHASRKVGDRARLFAADMRDLPSGEPVDLVTCLDDALNYVVDRTDLGRAFACAARRLRAGGIYAFDLNSLRAFREDFATERTFVSGRWRFRWMGHGSCDASAGCTATATIDARGCHGGPVGPIRSRHVQQHHPTDWVGASLERAGFAEVHIYGQHRDGRLEEEFDELLHAKAIVVGRRT
jgi:SAM-dependent methyltransferase